MHLIYVSVLLIVLTSVNCFKNVNTLVKCSSMINKCSISIKGVAHRNRYAKPLSLSLSSLSDISVSVYDLQLWFSHFVSIDASLSPATISILYAAGLLAAFSPCSLSLLPLTLAYLGNPTVTSTSDESKTSSLSSSPSSSLSMDAAKTAVTGTSGGQSVGKIALYTTGFATSLSLTGVSAAMLGKVFGSSSILGDLPKLTAALLSIYMGLYLLELVTFNFPSIERFIKNTDDKSPYSAFVLGGSSALVASPCSSPVLASILALISTSADPLLGFICLLSYSLGYATPLVLAGSLSGYINNSIRNSNGITGSNNFSWINSLFAAIFICYGTYTSFDLLLK